MIPIFCLHFTKLTERKVYCDQLFNKFGLRVNWIESYDPDSSFSQIDKTINDGELSLFLKTKYVYNIQKNDNLDIILILEDDIIIPNYLNFKVFLEDCINEFTQSEGDIVNLGGTRDFEVKNHLPNKIIYYDKNYMTRGTHAYIINKKFSSLCLNYMDVYTLPIDHFINNILKTHNFKSGWTHPYIEQWTDNHINQWKSSVR